MAFLGGVVLSLVITAGFCEPCQHGACEGDKSSLLQHGVKKHDQEYGHGHGYGRASCTAVGQDMWATGTKLACCPGSRMRVEECLVDGKYICYYDTCPQPPSPPFAHGDCCSGCGTQYCSPNSGRCYSTKAKDYYNTCPSPPSPPASGGCTAVGQDIWATGTKLACCPGSRMRVEECLVDGKYICYYDTCPQPPSPPFAHGDCCSGCGTQYCSPNSGRCYSTKAKDYYNTCPQPPSPPPASGVCTAVGQDMWATGTKLACCPGSRMRVEECLVDGKYICHYDTCPQPPSPPFAHGDCCSGCGTQYCSPNSGRCYSTKAKDYYNFCGTSRGGRR